MKKIKEAVTHEDNQRLVKKIIITIATSLFIGIVGTATSVIWSTNATNEQVKNLGLYTKENRSLIRENAKAITEIRQQGRDQIKIQTEIATSVKFIAQANEKSNQLLDKLIDKANDTATEQARRTTAIRAIRRHVENDDLHKK